MSTTPEEDLRGDLKHRLGIDVEMLRFCLAHPDRGPEVREYIERRIAAGNKSARMHKVTLQAMGTWE